MFKKLSFISLFIVCFFVALYPTKKENITIFNYCYALEKIITNNSIQSKKNLSLKVKSIAKDISKIGISKTKGEFINKMIDKYKNSKNSFIFDFVPNNIYCLGGYWIERIKPGTFESIFYEESKKTITELKDEADLLINDINSEYKILKEELLIDLNLEYENLKNDFNNLF